MLLVRNVSANKFCRLSSSNILRALRCIDCGTQVFRADSADDLESAHRPHLATIRLRGIDLLLPVSVIRPAATSRAIFSRLM